MGDNYKKRIFTNNTPKKSLMGNNYKSKRPSVYVFPCKPLGHGSHSYQNLSKYLQTHGNFCAYKNNRVTNKERVTTRERKQE